MTFSEAMPFLIPLIAVQVSLLVISLVHIYRHRTYRVGNRLLWTIVAFISIIGPIAYFAFGRSDE